ncbi:MAG: hypothetical protein RL318_2857 [Fibrobacterota bacterium]|jgi:hypothetical protein
MENGRIVKRIGPLAVTLLWIAGCQQSEKTPGSSSADSTGVPVTDSVKSSASACLVDSLGVGGIRLGMSLATARKALPGARFERSGDGDGMASVTVKRDSADWMDLYTTVEDPEAALTDTETVTVIQTTHEGCATAGGVHPGLPLDQAAAKLGALTEISLSEIESREYATFAATPQWLGLRVDGAGIYAGELRTTKNVRADGKITSLTVSKGQ